MYQTIRMNPWFADELTNFEHTSEIRKKKLEALEQRVVGLIQQMDELKARGGRPVVAGPAPGQTGRVAHLIQFHQQRIAEASQDLPLQLQKLRLWLVRQGAKLTRNGHIIVLPDNAPVPRVRYDSELEQEATRVHIVGGLMLMPNGKPLDTRTMATAFSGPGYAIYVMSREGHLHVASHVVGIRHHSSLLAGAPVAGAGEMVVNQGRLVHLTNKSGHYAPPRENLIQVVNRLARAGIDPHTYTVGVLYPGGKVESFPNADEFLRSEAPPFLLDDDDDDDGYTGYMYFNRPYKAGSGTATPAPGGNQGPYYYGSEGGNGGGGGGGGASGRYYDGASGGSSSSPPPTARYGAAYGSPDVGNPNAYSRPLVDNPDYLPPLSERALLKSAYANPYAYFAAE